jgi:hypothetical protein
MVFRFKALNFCIQFDSIQNGSIKIIGPIQDAQISMVYSINNEIRLQHFSRYEAHVLKALTSQLLTLPNRGIKCYKYNSTNGVTWSNCSFQTNLWSLEEVYSPVLHNWKSVWYCLFCFSSLHFKLGFTLGVYYVLTRLTLQAKNLCSCIEQGIWFNGH